MIAVAGAALLALALGTMLAPAPPAQAQNACSASCRAAYGSCY